MGKTLYIETVRALLPARPPEGHKGTFGHVFVIAGSRGFTGAAKLAALGAARSGVGLVTVGVPKPLGDLIGAALLEQMSFMLPSTEAETLSRAAFDPAFEFAASKDAVVLGPGISQHDETIEFVLEFAKHVPQPLLIDADGLNCLSRNPEILKVASGPRVLTPHPGEMARLLGGSAKDIQADRDGAAASFAEDHGCVLVLKGYHTVIAAPGRETCFNPTGNAGLASGGTGDVLSGLIGGLMAQGLDGYDAARLGVYLHGLAGDIAAERLTQRAMIAGDVANALPEAWRRLEDKSGGEQ